MGCGYRIKVAVFGNTWTERLHGDMTILSNANKERFGFLIGWEPDDVEKIFRDHPIRGQNISKLAGSIISALE